MPPGRRGVPEEARVKRPVRRRRYSLKELLARVDECNLHGEARTERPVGNESW